ncbi:hypothetical protein ACM66B_005327 [Microbotryomycetes sp. NB124-2]
MPDELLHLCQLGIEPVKGPAATDVLTRFVKLFTGPQGRGGDLLVTAKVASGANSHQSTRQAILALHQHVETILGGTGDHQKLLAQTISSQFMHSSSLYNAISSRFIKVASKMLNGLWSVENKSLCHQLYFLNSQHAPPITTPHPCSRVEVTILEAVRYACCLLSLDCYVKRLHHHDWLRVGGCTLADFVAQPNLVDVCQMTARLVVVRRPGQIPTRPTLLEWQDAILVVDQLFNMILGNQQFGLCPFFNFKVTRLLTKARQLYEARPRARLVEFLSHPGRYQGPARLVTDVANWECGFNYVPSQPRSRLYPSPAIPLRMLPDQ